MLILCDLSSEASIIDFGCRSRDFSSICRLLSACPFFLIVLSSPISKFLILTNG